MPTKERWAKMTEEQKQKYSEYAKVWKQENKERWNQYQKEQYRKTYGEPTRNMNHTLESKAQWHRDKVNLRCTRAKQARFTDELTAFVTKEAHELRKLRNKVTGIEWHVDHIEPLKGEDVCGLHIWSNLAVIPKTVNLSKGNKRALY